MNCAKEFQGTELVIGLSGIEYTNFRVQNADEDSKYQAQNKFLNAQFQLKRYEDNKLEDGVFQYDFYFKIPEWAPQSTQYKSSWNEAHGRIHYLLFC